MSIENDKLVNLEDAKVLYDDLRGRIPDVSGKLDKPQTPGTQGQVLTSDGLGGQTWEDPTGGDPTEIIDDTAGEGDTDKVLSADKIAEIVSNLNGAIDAKPEIKDSTSTGIDLDISDENGNVILRLKDGHVKTREFDSEEVKSGILFRNHDITDGVYASCRWHQPNSTDKQFCLLMGTDLHGDQTRLANMVKYLNALDAFDAGICLGDIVGTDWRNSAEYYTAEISKTEKPFLTVIGNHDAGYNTLTTGYTYIADLVDKFITPNIQYADLESGEYPSGKSYYFKDFATYGIRLIVLNNYEYPSDNDGTNFLYHRGYNCWSQDQVDWFISVLNSTPSNYGVIIANHFVPTSTAIDKTGIWTSSTMQYNSYSPDTVLDSADKNMMADIVDAWINGTSLSDTYAFNVSGGSWSGITVDADFTDRGNGEFITWIGGHLHMSIKGTIYTYTDQNVYLCDCSSLTAATQGDTPRRAGTRSEDALCVLAVDRTAKTVKLLRVGAHFTKDGIDRLYGAFNYGGV